MSNRLQVNALLVALGSSLLLSAPLDAQAVHSAVQHESSVNETPDLDPAPGVVGDWGFSYQRGRATLILVIRVDRNGQLVAHWLTGEERKPITRFRYEEGTLRFESEIGNYEGRQTNPNGINGNLTTKDRTYSVYATRLGVPIIGTWKLRVSSADQTHNEQLIVRPDLSGQWRRIRIDRVRLEGENPFHHEQPFEVRITVNDPSDETPVLRFAGRVKGKILTGQLERSDGNFEVQGTRVEVRNP